MNLLTGLFRANHGVCNFIRLLSRTVKAVPDKALNHKIIYGKKINFEIFGNKGPVVAFNSGGIGDFRLQYDTVIRKLLPDLTVVAWDPPGFGYSEKEKRSYDADNFCLFSDAKYALELMRTLGYSKYSIIGLSNGGITGAVMAADAPVEISKIVLCNTLHALHHPKLLKKTEEMFNGMRGGAVGAWYTNLYGEIDFEDKLSGFTGALKNPYEMRKVSEMLSKKLQDVNAETLYFRTQDDLLVHDSMHMEKYKKDLSHMRIHLEPVGGHNLIQCSEKFAHVVKEFLMAN